MQIQSCLPALQQHFPCGQVEFLTSTTKRNLSQKLNSSLVEATEAEFIKRSFILQGLGVFPVSEVQDTAIREFSYYILSSKGQNLRKIRSQQTLYGSVTLQTKSLQGAERDAFSERLFFSNCHTDFINKSDCYILRVKLFKLS